VLEKTQPVAFGAHVGRVAFKRRATPFGRQPCLLPPLCVVSFHLPSPRMGVSAVFAPPRWRDATPWELVPFSHRSASRIFIMQPGCTPPPAVTQDGDLRLDGGGERAGLRPLPLPQPQGFSSPRLGRGECRVGVGPCAGGGPLLHLVMGGRSGCCPWCWQLQRARSSDASGFGAARGAGAIAGAGHGLTSNSTAFCPSLPHEFLAWAGASRQRHPP
jgi:hypothetical protein